MLVFKKLILKCKKKIFNVNVYIKYFFTFETITHLIYSSKMKDLITILSGSNRKDNLTFHFAQHAYQLLQQKKEIDVKLVDLSAFEPIEISNDMYTKDSQPKAITQLQDTYIVPSTRFWFFIPEYNGSYPGIVKLILDILSVRLYKESFDDKKACITGIASGRAGNLRGMDHLSSVLNHLGMHVHPNKVPISSIYNYLNENKKLTDNTINEVLEKQIEQLLSF